MAFFSKEVLYFSEQRNAPVRKIFRIEADSLSEATPILEKMAELYRQRLEGRKPKDDAVRLRSIPKEQNEASERTIRMLKGIFKR